jgi:drug/metabolite transporter (DMT)-like permease
MRYLPLAVFAGLSLLWGSEWLLTASLPTQPRLHALAIEYGIASACLLPWAVRRRFWQHKLRSAGGVAITGIGILCIPQVLICVAGRTLSPTISLLALALVPVFLAISGRITISLAVCGVAGVVFLVDRSLNISAIQLRWLPLPLAAAAILARSLVAAERQSNVLSIPEVLLMQCVASASLLCIASPMLEHETITWSVIAAIGFIIQTVLIVVCGYLLFYWLLRKRGAGRTSMLQWTQPLIVIGESAVLMQPRLLWSDVAGAILVVTAIALAFSNREGDRGVFFEITQT